ncbi:putative leucine-rich repeat receptor-like protein kinase At2g19210 [Arachis ipaensis]|uniref:putative leucine-rich repeat receptor-like protein kinase At2g19210 isoform X1 n=1 Tax=Arachis hypogaea TaxID=3818 RepID=UPI0007AF99BE|nr:putative leucine-rich repeat receptor-like protein kinase At2g19210 [Arachis ipaensis]XP_025671388.1 putative leucine-rich repeat receptor-like protein kinase At2g19210 [Arachis hypogaea]
MWRTILNVALLAFLVHAVVLQALDQSGFISIDCGALPNSTDWKDIQYISDVGIISSGVAKSVSSDSISYFKHNQLWTLRSFPEGRRNCYKINNITIGSKYLIRLEFAYGNYDGSKTFPKFDVYLGVNKWDTVSFGNATLNPYGYETEEIIHIASQEYINICLVNTGHGTPFISTIDLRPLKNDTYSITSPSAFGSLVNYYRDDFGYSSSDDDDDDYIRYVDDPFDRQWRIFMQPDWVKLSDSSITTADAFSKNDYQLPAGVMNTAITPANASDPLVINWRPEIPISDVYYIYMHFMEVEAESNNNEIREFNIFVDGKLFSEKPVQPPYLSTKTIRVVVPNSVDISLEKTPLSTLPPIINAIEVYELIQFHQLDTFQADVDAITRIQSVYGLAIREEWQGDPCGPAGYMWEWDGLNCTRHLNESPRITALNLSSSGLTGAIDPSFSHLTMLEKLDLSNNHLNGQVPEFLSQLQNLKILNLAGNNLSGSLPSTLLEKSNKGFLSLNVDQNPYLLCESGECKVKKKKKKTKPFLVAAAIGLSVVLVAVTAAAIVWTLNKRRKTKVEITPKEIKQEDDVSLKFKNKIYSYSDILKITNNFCQILGKGGFGTVYMGYVDDAPVAVKMLSQSSVQGYQQFQAEVKLLMRVHHRNLTSLVGYCNEGSNKALIYEYMANGNLHEHLSSGTKFLSWKDRLCIAVDAAQGLEYLHNGCKPPIIHRDVKASNILLTENLHAKLSDFGLSKIIPIDGGSHVSTVVAGTAGYLDPNYYQSSRLTEKSDIYSFGVVLLELITSQAAIRMAEDDDDDDEKTHLSHWVSSMVERGDIHGIVDSRLGRDFDCSSAWKVVETAMACVSQSSNERPIMSEVLIELKNALAMELSQTKYGGGGNKSNGDSSVELVFVNVQNESTPQAR